MTLLTDIAVNDTEGVKWAKTQRWLRYIADQASITYTMSGLLSDISVGDTEGVKWAKVQRWLKLIAENISGGGGGGVTQILAGTNITVSPVGGTGVVTVNSTGGGNNYATVANNAGNTTVTADADNYSLGITVGGAARTSIIILATTGAAAGDTITLPITLPATAAIVLEVRNATAGGTLLLPAEIFTAQQYTTNGFDLSATWQFVYTGTAWKFVTSNIPA